MVAATLCGITDRAEVKRSVCAMGHKWLWNASLGGLPPKTSLPKLIRCSLAFAKNSTASTPTSDKIAGHAFRLNGRNSWGSRLASRFRWAHSTRTGTPSAPVAAPDDMVNVVGTSTCIIGITPSMNLVPGVCGVVQGSVHPHRTGIEAGLSAVGDIFNAIATPRRHRRRHA